MSKSERSSVNRRNFLKTAVTGVTAVAASSAAGAIPSAVSGQETPAEADVLTTARTGSDFMIDALKTLDLEYAATNPGSSFRALHESLINYGGNRSPEMITCCHEESAVGIAHGYAKIEGKPMAVLAHGTVGLQHASMALFNAFCDRVPVYVVVGNTSDAVMRRPGAEWVHSVQDAAAIVRDYVKWDDAPASLGHFAESAVRGYRVTVTPPAAPVLIVCDSELQEKPLAENAKLPIPKLTLAAPPQGDDAAVKQAAQWLLAAQNPVLVADRYARTPAGIARLIELAELLQAPVVDTAARMNFPSQHPLNHSERAKALVAGADVLVALEMTDLWGLTNQYRDQLQRTSQPVTKPGAKLVTIGMRDLYIRSNYQEFQRFEPVDLAISAEAETTLPSLIEAVRSQMTPARKSALEQRGARLARTRQQMLDRAREEATYAWDASPISTARLSAELWAQVQNEDWSLVSDVSTLSRWPLRLWSFDKHYHYIGGSGGAGIGYGAPAAVGAALANRKHGRLSINFQKDGDLMYGPGVLWTAAHHRIPLLSVMHNNRAYHQEVMHIQRMANRHERAVDSAHIGTTITDPNIDFAKLAQGLGVHAEGPIDNPRDLGPAIRRAIDIVKKGEPALIDVVTQPR
jgi:acetolactate synthase I/II/III large subunit